MTMPMKKEGAEMPSTLASMAELSIRIFFDGGNDAEPDAQDRGDDHGRDRQQDRSGQGLHQDLPHLSFCLVRPAKVGPFQAQFHVPPDEDPPQLFPRDLLLRM